MTSPGARLRAAIESGTIQVPGAPFALAGRLIERLGFPATYISGAAFSAGILGVPDIGLFTLTELAQHTAYLTRQCTLPVIVDADTGFGELPQVRRTVIELQAAGAAAIQLEDQVLRKRCGHLPDKELIDCGSMCDKIATAAAAKTDRDLVLVARTDARGVTGWDDAVARARAYLEAGADWIFPEALTTLDEFQRFAHAIDAPLVANMTEFGKSPSLSFGQLRAMGYAAVLYPVTLLRLAMHAAETGLREIQAHGSQAALLNQMQTRQQLYELLDYDGR